MSYLQIQRQGRFSELGSWQEQYRKKLTTPAAAAALIRDHDNLNLTGSANVPQAFEAALLQMMREKGYEGVDIYSACPLLEHAYMRAENRDLVQIHDHFLGEDRRCAQNHNLNYYPLNFSRLGEMNRYQKARVWVAGVTPPDKDGWMSRSIWGSDFSRKAFTDPATELIIVEVNRNLPYLCGDSPDHLKIHVSEVDYIIENDYEWPELKSKAVTETEQRTADFVSEMVRDGDCLQIGYGGLADAIGANLIYAGKKDLGIHTEVMTTCVANLMKHGVLNNSRKRLYPGKAVASQVTGDRSLWEFVDHNPDCEFMEIAFINDLRTIIQNDNVLSINNAVEVDLTGQVASEAMGTFQYSGTGGQLEWVIGSQMSKGGRSIIVLNSTYTDKQGVLHSKINPTLPLGAVVTTPRTYVQYVATEYGVADLKFKSTRQRALALIAIAHPAFRDELTFAARKYGWLT